jgi:FkbM family methyltransferase
MGGMKQLKGRTKKLALKLLEHVSSVTPLSAKLAILNEALGADATEKVFPLLAQMAASCGITGFSAKGQYGTICSTPSDFIVFGTYARSGTWAERTNAMLWNFFQDSGGGTYLDVGANIGLTTIPVARNRSVKCVAFEPEPTNFENLKINVAVNCPFGNVEVKQFAVFDRSTTVDFEIEKHNLGDHRIRLTNSPGSYEEQQRRVIRVPTATLDDLTREVQLPLAVKIDTQGAEPFVFGGGGRTLAKADLIICEWWPYGMKRLNGNPEVIAEFFRQQSVTISIAERENVEARPPVSAPEAFDQLLATVADDRDNPYYYVDLTARRTRE